MKGRTRLLRLNYFLCNNCTVFWRLISFWFCWCFLSFRRTMSFWGLSGRRCVWGGSFRAFGWWGFWHFRGFTTRCRHGRECSDSWYCRESLFWNCAWRGSCRRARSTKWHHNSKHRTFPSTIPQTPPAPCTSACRPLFCLGCYGRTWVKGLNQNRWAWFRHLLFWTGSGFSWWTRYFLAWCLDVLL